MALGVEEPHGLSAGWDHDQPRREELDGHHPAMEPVNGNSSRPRDDSGDHRERDGGMPRENETLKKWGVEVPHGNATRMVAMLADVSGEVID